MIQKKLNELASFMFNGSRVSLRKTEDGFELLTWGIQQSEDRPTVEPFSKFESASRAFEQTTRGIFFQAACFPFTLPLPDRITFNVKDSYQFQNTDAGLIYLSYDNAEKDYDIRVTKDVVIYTKDWPRLSRSTDAPAQLRLRIFNTGNFRVLYDDVAWDNGISPRPTTEGYDIVHLRSRGNGTVRGSFYLNVPHEKNDSRFLVANEEEVA